MSDGYFDDFDELDSAFLNEVDAIVEASQLPRSNPTPTASPPKPKPSPPKAQAKAPSSDDFDMTFDVDAEELERLDEFIADSYEGKAKPVAGPSLTRQTTLDGKVLPVDNSKQAPRSFNKTKSSSNNPFGKTQKTKKWDHTAFSETGWISTKKARQKAAGKGKAKEMDDDEDDDDEDDEDEVEFEQFPAPFVSGIPPAPMSLKADLLAARNWIYPLNRPRRDYQFNIAKRCLFQNTLVALPTGLGKTFIAGVVMLNYYKWFPESRIVFLAPTKPLVAQQVEACHQVCGIPGSDAAELTGHTKSAKRSVAWAEKRVMYMTPQTLVKDFQSCIVDPRDIVLIVFDEAHRGTGDYAYAQIMRYMMAKNPHFRVLALTATPGNNAEAVQAIVDSLHISHIEIRNEESQDLSRYVLKKVVDTHIIKMSDSLNRVSSLLSKVIEPLLNKVRNSGLVYQQSPIMLHSYACQAAIQGLHSRKDLGWAWGYLKVLGSLARSMAYLMETSIRSCYRSLMELQDTLSTSNKQSDKTMLKLLKGDKNWTALLVELEKQKAHGFDPHPKMEKLISLALRHFVEADAEAAAAIVRGEPIEGESKVMVFVQFRDCVDEIMDRLKHHHPLIRPTPFIGQGTDKRGNKGISQKEQLETIRKFKAGEFNVLVSTSIGEEGLDIGEIDEIICYDAQKSSVRMLQRVGRTGRKRAGKVDVLLAEQREERNWQKSKDNYEDVQYTIISGNQLELYDDVERLVPGTPECLQVEMPIEAYVRSPQKEKKTKEAPTRKRKRNDDINRNIPLGALTGFVTASELRPKGKKKTAKSLGANDLDSDSDDADIAAGLGGITSKKKTKKSQKGKAGSSKGATKSSQAKLDLFLVPEHLEDDEDDLDIQIGLEDILQTPSRPRSKVKLSDSDLEISPIQVAKARRKLAAASDEDPSTRPLAKAKGRKKKATRPGPSAEAESSNKANPSWLLEGSSDGEGEGKSKPSRPDLSDTKNSSVSSKSTSIFKSAKTRLEKSQKYDIPTPKMPDVDLAIAPPELPRPTFPIRAPKKGRRVQLPPSSPQEDDKPAPRRLVRRRSPSPIDEEIRISNKKRKFKLPANPAMFDTEAIHSGEEVSEGSSDVDMVESESDRQFLQEPGQTQVPLSYNQTAAYRMGLMTQAPDHLDGPRFSSKPKRVGRFAGGRTQVPRPSALDSSPQRSDVIDEYHMGSFVVNDDEPIIYSNSSEP